MCRSSAKDTSHVVDLVAYYGRIIDIILLDYNVFYVPLFRCQWAVRGNGVKVEDGFTLVNLNQNQVSFLRDPYIIASQAKQVFYLKEDDSSSWYVVMRGSTRRYSKEDVQDGLADIGPLPAAVDMDIDIDDAETSRTDCEGIYVPNVASFLCVFLVLMSVYLVSVYLVSLFCYLIVCLFLTWFLCQIAGDLIRWANKRRREGNRQERRRIHQKTLSQSILVQSSLRFMRKYRRPVRKWSRL